MFMLLDGSNGLTCQDLWTLNFSFGASHLLNDSTTDRPLFDVKFPDLNGRAGGQGMFFL